MVATFSWINATKKRKYFHNPVYHVGMGCTLVLTTFFQISAPLWPRVLSSISQLHSLAPFNEILPIFEVGDILLALSCKMWRRRLPQKQVSQALLIV